MRSRRRRRRIGRGVGGGRCHSSAAGRSRHRPPFRPRMIIIIQWLLVTVRHRFDVTLSRQSQRNFFILFSFSRVLCPTQHSIPLFLFVCCVCYFSPGECHTRRATSHDPPHEWRRWMETFGVSCPRWLGLNKTKNKTKTVSAQKHKDRELNIHSGRV